MSKQKEALQSKKGEENCVFKIEIYQPKIPIKRTIIEMP
jgi:hypothetical protein